MVVAGGEVAGLYEMEADALIRARALDGGSVVPLRVNEAQCVKGDRPATLRGTPEDTRLGWDGVRGLLEPFATN